MLAAGLHWPALDTAVPGPSQTWPALGTTVLSWVKGWALSTHAACRPTVSIPALSAPWLAEWAAAEDGVGAARELERGSVVLDCHAAIRPPLEAGHCGVARGRVVTTAAELIDAKLIAG